MKDTALRFYREGKSWYADIPLYLATGGSKADCLMVAGADALLDEIAGKRNSVILAIRSTEAFGPDAYDTYPYVIHCFDSDCGGWGHYTVIRRPCGSKADKVSLCPVSAFVFGWHPMFIGFKEVVE